jgi:hypothetical protein
MFTNKNIQLPVIGDRVLLDIIQDTKCLSGMRYFTVSQTYIEAILMEISPSGKHYLFEFGSEKEWRNIHDFKIREILKKKE